MPGMQEEAVQNFNRNNQEQRTAMAFFFPKQQDDQMHQADATSTGMGAQGCRWHRVMLPTAAAARLVCLSAPRGLPFLPHGGLKGSAPPPEAAVGLTDCLLAVATIACCRGSFRCEEWWACMLAAAELS